MRRATIVLFALIISSPAFARLEDARVVPKKLIVFAGGYWTGPWHVELDWDALLYWRGGPEERKAAERIKPSLSQWREFRRELDEIGIWRWRSDYSTHAIYDATAWTFEIAYSDHAIKTGGDSGVFPGRDGARVPLGPPRGKPTNDYSRYVQAMRKLLGRDTFPQ